LSLQDSKVHATMLEVGLVALAPHIRSMSLTHE